MSAANLRLWEKRYGWPLPERNSSGYRLFTEQQIGEIKRLANLLAKGRRIGALIADGKPLWPTELVPKRERPAFDFKDIPQPGTPTAKWIRGQLEEALRQHDEGLINWAKAQAQTFRPEDRERAVFALLAKAGRREGAQAAPPPAPIAAPDDAPPPSDLQLAGKDLKGAVLEKLAAHGLGLAETAQRIGVSLATLRNLVSKGTKPHARTTARVQAWLQAAPEALVQTGDVEAPPSPASAPEHRSLQEVLGIVRAAIERHRMPEQTPPPILEDALAMKVHGASTAMRAAIARLVEVEQEEAEVGRGPAAAAMDAEGRR